MAFRIRNNYEADVGLTYLNYNRTKLSKLEQQLATGLRIVRAADDASDLFIADYLKHTHVGLQRGTLNAQYGLAAARIADDALGKIYDILVKIKDKIVEAANARDAEERYQIQSQINEYVRNIAQIVGQTEFDGRKLLNGDHFIVHFGSHTGQYLVMNGSVASAAGLAINVQAGSTGTAKAVLGFNKTTLYGLDNLGGGAYAISLGAGVSALTINVYVTSTDSGYNDLIQTAINRVEAYMTAIDRVRGYYGNIENKLQNIIENNQMLIDNMKEAESQVRNVDYASAMAEFTKMQTIMQANIAALAQANQIPQLVQQLLR